MNHIMVDLETLSSKSNAVILSLGAVKMDLVNFKLGPEFYKIISPGSQLQSHIEASTVLWWEEQSDQARAVLRASKHAAHITVALSEFSAFCNNGVGANDLVIWGNGATFDNMILRHAYEAYVGIPYPTNYKHDLCFRTAKRLLRLSYPVKGKGVVHNALDDAKTQAEMLVRGMEALHNITDRALGEVLKEQYGI